MALSDLVIPTESFAVGNTIITIRGLNVDDVAALFLNNRDDVERFVEMWRKDEGQMTPDFIAAVLRELPDLVAKTIACAAGEPDAWQNARKLNGPTQLVALNAIGRMTFEGVPLKKFLEGVLVLAQGLASAMQEFAPPTPSTGTGG